MAELNSNNNSIPGKKGRVRKETPKVDLTAMVDLAFLLITFFMLTTSLNKPNALDVAVPDNSINTTVDMDQKRIINILILDNMYSIVYGDIKNPLQIIENINLDKHALRQHLTQLKQKVNTDTGKNAIVLIKPSNEAIAKNIIQSFDEIRSAGIRHYMLSKLTKEEEMTF